MRQVYDPEAFSLSALLSRGSQHAVPLQAASSVAILYLIIARG
jgi:hypothetical protein